MLAQKKCCIQQKQVPQLCWRKTTLYSQLEMENSSTQEIISLPISHIRIRPSLFESPDNDLAFVNAIKTYDLPGGESQEEMRKSSWSAEHEFFFHWRKRKPVASY